MPVASDPAPIKILIVDDNVDMLDVMRLMLQPRGYDTAVAVDCESAMQLNAAVEADVLIADLFMPGTDGLETIRKFREAWPDIRVIAMSGGSRAVMHDYLKVAAEIAHGVLRKPFTTADLLQAIGSALEQRPE